MPLLGGRLLAALPFLLVHTTGITISAPKPLLTDADAAEDTEDDAREDVGLDDWHLEQQQDEQEMGWQLPFRLTNQSLPVKHSRPVLWIHIHKAAGSTMCSLARKNSERIIRANSNCNWWPFDMPPVDGSSSVPISCEDRAAAFARQNATWGAVEHQILGPLCFKQFNYAVLLREPNELALSKANYARCPAEKVLRSMDCVSEHTCRDTCQTLWLFFDNFLVRQLAGQTDAKGGKITAEHAQSSIELLSKFQVVLLLEDIGARSSVLQDAFGWSVLPVLAANPSVPVNQLSSKEWERARWQNRHDYTVFEHFQHIPVADRVRAAT